MVAPAGSAPPASPLIASVGGQAAAADVVAIHEDLQNSSPDVVAETSVVDPAQGATLHGRSVQAQGRVYLRLGACPLPSGLLVIPGDQIHLDAFLEPFPAPDFELP